MKKIIIRCLIIIAILIPIAAAAHYAIFPQTSRCMLIGLSGFEKYDGIYFAPQTDVPTQKTVIEYVHEGKTRIESLFSNRKGTPVIIYCRTTDEFEKYGANASSPAVTQLSIFGEFVVINGTQIDKDVFAHEMCHSELQSQIGWYKRSTKIPTWFDEGLAMQVDYRSYYGEDSLIAAINNGMKMADVTKMKTLSEFNQGNDDEVWLHYAAAKHVVGQWYTKEKLTKFIKDMNDGDGFEKAYGQ